MIIKSRRIKKSFILINSLLLVIIILFVPIAFYSFNLDYYEILQERHGVFSVLNKDDVLKISGKIVDFFKYRTNLNFNDPALQARYANENISALRLFQPDEISHLYDVRTLLTKVLIIYFISVSLFFIIILLLAERNIKNFIKNLSMIFIITPALIIVFIIVLYFLGRNFPVLFENFHIVFFPQGNYAFAGDSLIISIFPFGFFYDFFIRLVTGSAVISVIFLFIGLIFAVISKLLKRRGKKEEIII